MSGEKIVAAELHLRSDLGFQHTSQAYFNLTQEYGIAPSMSRRGNPYDNEMAENPFPILRIACIYRHKPCFVKQADDMIDAYIYFITINAFRQRPEWRHLRCATPLKAFNLWPVPYSHRLPPFWSSQLDGSVGSHNPNRFVRSSCFGK